MFLHGKRKSRIKKEKKWCNTRRLRCMLPARTTGQRQRREEWWCCELVYEKSANKIQYNIIQFHMHSERRIKSSNLYKRKHTTKFFFPQNCIHDQIFLVCGKTVYSNSIKMPKRRGWKQSLTKFGAAQPITAERMVVTYKYASQCTLSPSKDFHKLLSFIPYMKEIQRFHHLYKRLVVPA